MKRIVIDLDGTICFPNIDKHTLIRYGYAKPNYQVIEKINRLQQKGYYIIIFTSRRMETHNGDINKIEHDVRRITELWLDYHGVQYNELVFGKPFSDTYYVDDKAMTINDFLDMNES